MEWVKHYARDNLSALPAVACCGAGLLCIVHGKVRAALALALAVALWGVWHTLPMTPNHHFALTLALLFVAWGSLEGPTERVFGAEELLKWLSVAIVFWAGMQKVLHGAYWNGSFLAEKVALEGERFQWLSMLCSEHERDAIRSGVPNGPFIPGCEGIMWVSRGIVLSEILLGLGLLVPRLRRHVATVAILVLVLMQVVAGELTFALVMCAMLSIFLDQRRAVGLGYVIVVTSCLLSALLIVFPAMPIN